MRIAVISDIHANMPALEAVLNASKLAGVDQYWCLGDMIGYYYWPVEVVDCIRDIAQYCIVGNHEQMLAWVLDNPEEMEGIIKKYGSGLQLAMEKLSTDARAWLLKLPENMKVRINDGVYAELCHGSPADTNEYLYPDCDDARLEQLSSDNVNYTFCGHTHYPMDRLIKNVRWINPGSVGQPRNRLPGAHWLLLDSETGAAQMKVESYDFASVLKACQMYDPFNKYLANVLQRK